MSGEPFSDGQGEFNAADFEAALEQDYQRIFRYVLSMVRVEAEAQDLTQEVLLRAHSHRTTLREQGALTAWLYRIATHVTLDRLRQRRRRDSMESESDPEEVEIADAAAPSLLDGIERGEMSKCVQDYVNDLKDPYRAAIVLHDLHDMTASEIAHLLDESLATVKMRLHRARLKLRAALDAGCEFSHDEIGLVCEPKSARSSQGSVRRAAAG